MDTLVWPGEVVEALSMITSESTGGDDKQAAFESLLQMLDELVPAVASIAQLMELLRPAIPSLAGDQAERIMKWLLGKSLDEGLPEALFAFRSLAGQQMWPSNHRLGSSRALTRELKQVIENKQEPGAQELLEALDAAELGADYAPLLGMRLSSPIRMRYSSILRYEYLLRYGRTRQGTSVESLIGELGYDPQDLLRIQQYWDSLHDRLAKQLEPDSKKTLSSYAALVQYEPATTARELLNRRPRPEDRELAREISEAEQLFGSLRDASMNIAKALREQSIEWERLEPEGLLGEYQPLDRTATIYTGMIEILAGHPSLRHRASAEAVQGALIRIAKLHEQAHGWIIHAEDCDGASWASYAEAPYRLHEALVTAYMRRMLATQDDKVFLVLIYSILEVMLPAEYRAGSVLLGSSAEEMRAVLREARAPKLPSLSLASLLIKAISEAAGQLAASMGKERFQGLRARVVKLAALRSGLEEQLKQSVLLFRSIKERYADAIPLLAWAMGRPWPGEAELDRWRFFMLSCRGPAIGAGRALRLHLDWIDDHPGESALVGQGDGANTASLELPEYQDALQRLGYAADDPRLLILQARSDGRGPR